MVARGGAAALRADRDDPKRLALLARFANEEWREYLARFYRENQGLDTHAWVTQQFKTGTPSFARLGLRCAVSARAVRSSADAQTMQ